MGIVHALISGNGMQLLGPCRSLQCDSRGKEIDSHEGGGEERNVSLLTAHGVGPIINSNVKYWHGKGASLTLLSESS